MSPTRREPRLGHPASGRRARIEALKEEARTLSGGRLESFFSPHCSPEVEEAFWEHVVSIEKRARGLAGRPNRTLADDLIRASVTLPVPERLDDRELEQKLWEVIEALAERQYFLCSTDHLSDRELYRRLWLEELREDFMPMRDAGSACILDLVGSGSEEDIRTYLTFYADARARQGWHREFPDIEMPPARPRPFDRDRRLPRPPWEEKDSTEPAAGIARSDRPASP